MRPLSAVFLLSCTGCVGVAAWPAADIMPPLNLGANNVIVTRCETTISGGSLPGVRTGPISKDNLVDVQVHDGRVERQSNFKMDWFLGLLLMTAYERHDLKLVLERPGFETVEVSSWPWWIALGYSLPRTIVWKELPAPQPPALIELPKLQSVEAITNLQKSSAVNQVAPSVSPPATP